jgi:hypothetical protein
MNSKASQINTRVEQRTPLIDGKLIKDENKKNIKEEVTKNMGKLRKKNQTEIQNTVEGHSSRLE